MVTFDHPASSSTAREESEGEGSEGEESEGEESEGEEMMVAMAAVKVECSARGARGCCEEYF
jgi:hypothetical protein